MSQRAGGRKMKGLNFFGAEGSSRAPTCWPKIQDISQDAYNIKIICMGTRRNRTSSGPRDRLEHQLAGQSFGIYVSKLITRVADPNSFDPDQAF